MIISSTLIERKWMRSAKAFRCTLALPEDSLIPAQLTALIDQKADIEIATNDCTVVIAPAFIVDVPPRGNKYTLVIETDNEGQNVNGPRLTDMAGRAVRLTILPTGSMTQTAAPAPEPVKRGTINDTAIRGLHVSFFKNPIFHKYIMNRTGEVITSPETCKTVFKALFSVNSCTEIDQDDFRRMLSEFNAYAATRANRGA